MKEGVDLQQRGSVILNHQSSKVRHTSSVFTKIHTGCRFNLCMNVISFLSKELVAFQWCRIGFWSYIQYTQRRKWTLFCVARKNNRMAVKYARKYLWVEKQLEHCIFASAQLSITYPRVFG